MSYEYKRIDTRTVEGIEKAEKLQAQGWKVVNVGFGSIIFEYKHVNVKG